MFVVVVLFAALILIFLAKEHFYNPYSLQLVPEQADGKFGRYYEVTLRLETSRYRY